MICQDEKIEGAGLGSDFHSVTCEVQYYGLPETVVIMSCFCSDDRLKNAEYIEYMASLHFLAQVFVD